MATDTLLRDRLEALVTRYDRRWIDSDPLRWPHLYPNPGDQEVVAVVAATLAYGRVASIHRSIESALERLGAGLPGASSRNGGPAAAVRPSVAAALPDRFVGWRHRFTAGEDLAWLLQGVGRAREEAGSLGAYVEAHARGDEPLRAGLIAWHRLAASVPAADTPVRRRARAFLLPDPARGAACKRTLLLARWCLRPSDGLDLGLWGASGRLGPRDLLVPLDTHVHRIARTLGLTMRKAADWRTAVEVTARLRRLDPNDPIRYDFALARPGIVGRCRHRHVPEICGACDLAPACRHGRPRGARKALTSVPTISSAGAPLSSPGLPPGIFHAG